LNKQTKRGEMSFDNDTDENESSLLLEYNIGYSNYIIKVCGKCKRKKENNCSLLRGFSRSACNKMSKAIKSRKQFKNIKSKVIDCWKNDIDNMLEVKRNEL
jgi:hypothetical protein